jgi:class 3 adenylate cyclase
MESSSRTLVCSVLFLDIVEYSKKPVAEQLQLKQVFNRVLTEALEPVPQRDRIILDTGDGAAVTFMGDPEDALFSAMSVRDMAGEAPVRLGVNLGPVRLVKDLNSQMNIIGDGINVAQRIMSFSRPGQLLVSRSFYEVVSCLSRDYVKLFRHEGSRTDKHVREHEVYSVIGASSARRPADTMTRTVVGDSRQWLAVPGPLGLRRSALIAAPLVFFLLVGSGVAGRSLLEVDIERVPPPPPRASFAPRPEPVVPVPATVQPVQQAAVGAGIGESVEKKFAGAGTSATAGRLELAVTPWGEVVVNGQRRGVSPPLRVLEIAPGSHTIEIKNSTFPTHVEKVEVKSGEAIKIRHRFR